MVNKINDKEVTNALYAGTLLMSSLGSLISNNYYCYNCNSEFDDSEGNVYRFKFTSEKAKRKVSISYNPPSTENDLHCFIVNIETDEGKRVYLDDLIQEYKLFEDMDYFNLNNYNGDTKQKIKKFVKFLDKVFTENIPDIISGKRWEHIGFDWQGYK